MIQSRRSFVFSITALVTLAPAFPTGLEARTQGVAAQQDDHEKFFNYIMKRAKELSQIKKNKNLDPKKAPYDTSQYEKFVNEVIQEYGVPINSSDVVKSENFLIGPLSDRIFVQCYDVPGPDGLRINAIWVFKDSVMLGGVGKNNLPIQPILYYAHKPS